MQGLLYGVRGERWTPPDDANQLMVGLSKVPMRLQELERPTPLRDDWAVAKTAADRDLRLRRPDGLHATSATTSTTAR